MSNDWNPDPGSEQADPFGGQQPGLAAGVFEPTFEDVIDTTKTLAQRVLGPLGILWLACAAVDFVFVILMVGLMFFFAGSMVGGIGMVLLVLVQIVAGVFVTGARVSLYAPMKASLLQGSAAVPDVATVIQMALPRVGYCILTNILASIAIGIGTLFCILPGLIAAFALAMAPYYTATGLGPIEAIQESVETAKRNWALLLGMLLVALIVFGAIALGNAIVTPIAAGVLGEYAYIGSQIAGWMLSFTIGALLWIVGGAVMITIDSAETGQSIKH